MGHATSDQAFLQRLASGLQETAGSARGKEQIVAKPTRHGDKWRIRWLDERGRRRSAVFDDYRTAQRELTPGPLALRAMSGFAPMRRGVR